MNAAIKVLFGGLSLDDAKVYAELLWLNLLNERWIKETLYRLETTYTEEEYTTFNENHQSGASTGKSGELETENDTYADSHGFQTGTRFVPHQKEVVASRSEYSREDEKISILAARFMELNPAECYVKLPQGTSSTTFPG